MNKSKKFSILVTLILASTVFLNINAQNFSDRIPGKEALENYETSYTTTVCDGDSNIIKAGCSVIAGQAVRGIPAMAFGASFDKIKGCVERMEQRSGTKATVNPSDTCDQFGLLNPNLDTSNFVYDPTPYSNNYSLLGLSNSLYNLNQTIIQNSFDSSYYAYKAVENVPVARNVFAQSTQELDYIGGYFQGITYNTWVTVRNISYALIGLLSIILGLTLMSSNSIFDSNAKWRLSLEQAIPRVVIAIILIQFSYLLGETLLYIANNSNFDPIFRYVFNITGSGWSRVGAVFSALSPTTLLGFVLSRVVAIGFLGNAILIGMLILGLWYLYRYLLVWWYNFSLILEICIFTIASPLIIAISLLPGEAGAQQTRRYFSTFLSLLSRTFLLQLISLGPTIIIIFFIDFMFIRNYTWPSTADAVGNLVWSPAVMLAPVILGIITLGYADNVQNLSNQFARNVTGADPIGAQPQGR